QIVMEIEPGLADPDDLRMGREGNQLLRRQFCVILCLVRMGTYRAPHLLVSLGNRPHPGKLVEPRADRQHRLDPCRAGPRYNCGALREEIRKIQVAMTVDQHGPALALYP